MNLNFDKRFSSVNPLPISRRRLLQFFSANAIFFSIQSVVSAKSKIKIALQKKNKTHTAALPATNNDLLNLAHGLESQILIKWNDPISDTERFGYNCDFTATYPLNSTEAILWVNHEYIDKLFYDPDLQMTTNRTESQIFKEREALGGSLIHIKKKNGLWSVKAKSIYNRRIHGRTKIIFSGNHEVAGKKFAEGTFANCAGGYTPWNTFLTCEENFHDFVGEAEFKNDEWKFTPSKKFKWENQGLDPRHYGWVVEIEPKTGSAKKHVAMGRFAHEGATTTLAHDKRCVVYMGDDLEGEHLYKFISKHSGDLSEGDLYVASLEKRQWLKLSLDNELLKGKFKDFVDLRVQTRKAAKLLSATPLNRPEDVAIHPTTQEIFVALTNSKIAGDLHGSLLKIKEKNSDPTSLRFDWEYLIQGGEKSNFSCPDNLVFDQKGNLWFTTDISEKEIHDDAHAFMGENSLFVMPLKGKNAGRAYRVLSGPHGSELTGPSFSEDGKTLFLSVQHPGGATIKENGEPLSHWPDGNKSWPKPSIVQISGTLLENPESLWS